MQQKIFITGTDTEVGKTFFTVALIRALRNAKQTVMAFKPVAAGCQQQDGQLKNEDALAIIDELMQGQAESLAYSTVNPIALEPPIAPHIAAELINQQLSVDYLQQHCPLSRFAQQFILVEGAGGWLVPLNQRQTLADYAQAEKLDIILVVGLKLGCINHAMLTYENIRARGLNVIGWVANHIDPQMDNQAENIQTLKNQLNCPLIAEIPYFDQVNPIGEASKCVRIEHILSS
ncbi:dethiobiotin synthase [Aliikangiella maris]|uniref:ATP-dependent dethiobiotin synthetase BioD n=2 Tax=Aliikangiella maris TaxID=3162458 RepID=A0ABV3MTR8_9GAMM